MRIKIGQKAQTAIELAVFGAILIFTLSVIMRAAVTRGNQQNAILRATRMALTMSYNTSASLTAASRNAATVLVVEDRLTADSGKYGAIDRAPTMTQGSGTHSANLFMPVAFGETDTLPLMDVFVNGKHFAFTTAAYKPFSLPTECSGGGSCSEWEENCIGVTVTGPCANLAVAECAANGCADCSAASTETYTNTSTVGCPKLYTIIDNHPLMDRWCTSAATCPAACSAAPAPGCNLSEDERFDLDRNDLDGVAGDVLVPPGLRENFAWQWFMVMGFDESTGGGSGPTVDNLSASGPLAAVVTSNGLLMAEGINISARKNVLVDVDQDLKMEQVMGITNSGGYIASVNVRDFQDGDIDFTHNDGDLGPPPGFTNNVKTYTFVRGSGPGGGTFLQIDEGKIFTAIGDSKQYVRTASKKDQVDMIERVFHISNNTGRFCSDAGAVNSRSDNPVEACGVSTGECFTSSNIFKTCLDIPNLMIFIRSWVADLHGRKWVTDYSDDPFIDF